MSWKDLKEDEYRKKLSPALFHIARMKGTEAPFSGKFVNHHEEGLYVCAVCKQPLFRSTQKFDSMCGWPSFFQQIEDTAINFTDDYSHEMVRTEITCSQCDSHLGHIFDDGPKPTGKRYCVNSVSLEFIPDKKKPAN